MHACKPHPVATERLAESEEIHVVRVELEKSLTSSSFWETEQKIAAR